MVWADAFGVETQACLVLVFNLQDVEADAGERGERAMLRTDGEPALSMMGPSSYTTRSRLPRPTSGRRKTTSC